MKYRRFGALDWDVSVLGFGVQGLAADAPGVEMIRTAIGGGVNYLDLGSPAGGRFADTTRLIRDALQDGYRERVRLAAHIPVTRLRCAADLDSLLDGQLQALGQEQVDVLILDGLDRSAWPALQALHVLDRAAALQAAGRVTALGFSFRDHLRFLRPILEHRYPWVLCQFHYSYLDADHLPGLSGVRYAASRGLAVVAAEPLQGGRLAREPPRQVAEIWAGAERARSLAGWGLHWVWNHPEVATVVCDMSTLDQVQENTIQAGSAAAGGLSIREQVLIGRVRDAYRKLRPIPCTACRVCMPCPRDIDVPRILELFNDAVVYHEVATARAHYRQEQHRLQDCDECGACADACGRMIAILDWLPEAREMLED